MRVVLDTNVLVSGFVSFKHPSRAPAQILHFWQAGLFDLCISDHILTEVEKTFEDPYFKKRLKRENIKIEDIKTLLQEDCILTSHIDAVYGIATHPEDDLVLATAVNAKADYLVTGDGPLLRKVGSSYQGVNLVTPNEFLQILQKQRK